MKFINALCQFFKAMGQARAAAALARAGELDKARAIYIK